LKADRIIHTDPLYKISIISVIYLVQLGGLEPPTSCSTDRRSNQLSYNCILREGPEKGLPNRRETRCNAALWQGRSGGDVGVVSHPKHADFWFTSPRLRGEVGAQRRVRRRLRESELAETPPHPAPLPPRGEKEKMDPPARPELIMRHKQKARAGGPGFFWNGERAVLRSESSQKHPIRRPA
jgi:hypothetical protein